MRSKLFVTGAVIGACMLVSPVSTGAAPLAGALSKDLAVQAGDTSLVVQVQRRRGGGRRAGGRRGGGRRGGGNAGVAAGIAGGLLLGTVILNEAARQQAIDNCARRFRSYDRDSMTYIGRDGYEHPCP